MCFSLTMTLNETLSIQTRLIVLEVGACVSKGRIQDYGRLKN